MAEKIKPNDITKSGPQSWRALQLQNSLDYEKSPISTSQLAAAFAPVKSLYDIQENAPQKVQSSFLSQGEGDSWGNSMFDEGYASPEAFRHLENTRAENQPWYAKAAAGIGKGIVLAGTTFIDGTVGLLAGIGQGIYNLADEDPNTGFWLGIWDNPVTQCMNEINKIAEKEMPNYYTDEQRNGPWYSADNIFSANFLFDKVVKNMGFMIGAAYAGGIYTKAIGLGTRTIGGTRALMAARKAGLSEEAIKRAQQLGKFAADNSSASRTTKKTVGAFFSALAEAVTEAVSNSDDFVKTKTTQLENQLRDKYAAIQQRYEETKGKLVPIYGPEGIITGYKDPAIEEYDIAMAELNQERQEGLNQIESARRGMGTMDFALNIPILWAGDILTLGKFYAGGWKAARTETKTATRATKEALKEAQLAAKAGDTEALKRLEQIVAKAERTGYQGLTKEEQALVEEVLQKFIAPKWMGYTRVAIQNPAKEGNEEMAQAAASKASWGYYGSRIDVIEDAYNDAQSRGEVQSWLGSLLKGISEQYGNFDNYEEAAIGAITGMLGAPTLGRSNNKTDQTWLGRNQIIGFSGGTFVDIRDYSRNRQQAEETALRITQIMKNPQLANRLKHLVAQTKFENDKKQAIIHDDKRAYKDAETAAIFEDIMYLKKGQRLDLLTNAVQSMDMDLTDEELQELVAQTQKSESAYNARINDDVKAQAASQKRIESLELKYLDYQNLLNALYEQLQKIGDPSSTSYKLYSSQMASLSQLMELLTEQIDEEKSNLDNITSSIDNSRAVEVSPYIKQDGTFMDVDEIREDFKSRVKRILEIINDVSEAQDQIDKSTGETYTDELLATLTWYSVMMRDWSRRSNGIMDIVKDAVNRAINDPTVSAQLELFDKVADAIGEADPIYGGVKAKSSSLKQLMAWLNSILDVLNKVKLQSPDAGTALAHLLSETKELTLLDGTKMPYGEYLMQHLKASIDANSTLNAPLKEYLKAQLDDLKELGIATRKYNELLEEYRKHPEKIDLAKQKSKEEADKKVINKKAKGIADRFNWDDTTGEILETLLKKENKQDIENLGGMDAFIKMLNPSLQKKIRAALLLEKGINGLRGSIEHSDIGEAAINIANSMIDEKTKEINNIQELADKILEDLAQGYIERLAAVFFEGADDRILAERVPKVEEGLQLLFKTSIDKITADLERIEREQDAKLLEEAKRLTKKEEELEKKNVPVEKELVVPTEGEFTIPSDVITEASYARKPAVRTTLDDTLGKPKEEKEKPDSGFVKGAGTPGYERRPQISLVFFNGVNGMKYSEALLTKSLLESGKVSYPKFTEESGLTKELYLHYVKTMEEYFAEKGTYEFVHSKLKAGDTIEFFCDSELNRKVFGDDSKLHGIVLMKVGDQVVGSIKTVFEFDAHKATGKENKDIDAQERLYRAVLAQQYGDREVDPITTKVSALLRGTLPISSVDKTLTEIFGSLTPVVAVIKGGRFITSDPNVKHEDVLQRNPVDGLVYVLIPTNNGKYLPALTSPTKLETLAVDDPYIQACREAFLNIGSSAVDIPNNMAAFWKLCGIDLQSFHVNLRGMYGKKATPISSLRDAGALALRFTDSDGNDIEHTVRIRDGKVDSIEMENAFNSIIKNNIKGLNTRVDINKLSGNKDAVEDYVRKFVLPYNNANLYSTDSINDWFQYAPTDIEQQVLDATPKSTLEEKGMPGSTPHTQTRIVNGKPVEVTLGEAIIDGKIVTTQLGPATTILTEGTKKGNSAMGSVRRTGTKVSPYRIGRGRKTNMLVTDKNSQEPMSTKDRTALDIAEVRRMFPTLGEVGIKLVHSALLRSTDNDGNPIKAYGKFKDGLVILAKKHPVGTVYHEAFHYVVEFLLSGDQKSRMWETAKDQYGELSELELEEKIAEGFRAYMNKMSDKSLSGRIKSFFYTLRHLINGLIGRENYLDNMFYRMYKGKFAEIDTKENYEAKLLQYKMQKFAYKNLPQETKDYLQLRKTPIEVYEDMTVEEKEVFLHCM